MLDVGGAIGVYAGPLAQAGYRVRVVDPVPAHVVEAAARPRGTAVLVHARALPVADRSIDAVLLLGRCITCLERADRVRVWRAATRVLRAGGVVMGATISRFAVPARWFRESHVSDHGSGRWPSAPWRWVHRNIDAERRWFTGAYAHHPDELAGEVMGAGLVVRLRVAVEFPVVGCRAGLAEILASRRLLLEMTRSVEDEPSLLGACGHVLTIATRVHGWTGEAPPALPK